MEKTSLINCQYVNNCGAYDCYVRQQHGKTADELVEGVIHLAMSGEYREYRCRAIDEGDYAKFTGCAHLKLLNLLDKLTQKEQTGE